MSIFKGQNLLEFSDRFKTDLDCKKYLVEIKSETPYKCSRCNHVAYQSLKDFSRNVMYVATLNLQQQIHFSTK